jgi:CheY-like chemotaxis protein
MFPMLNSKIISLSEVPLENCSAITEIGKPVVLVVDDERIIADTLSMILSKSGYEVLTAYDGASALELGAEAAPDLLITDVMMPGMTGIELTIAFVQAVPECKTLLFSGQAATMDMLEEARTAGHDFTVLSKPVHPTDMLRRVSDSLSMSLRVASAPSCHAVL